MCPLSKGASIHIHSHSTFLHSFSSHVASRNRIPTSSNNKVLLLIDKNKNCNENRNQKITSRPNRSVRDCFNPVSTRLGKCVIAFFFLKVIQRSTSLVSPLLPEFSVSFQSFQLLEVLRRGGCCLPERAEFKYRQ